ncbi:MAG: DNA polymerase I [Clostridia bacterium]|nr:DNA polymerase I [Clostridia bacterium]
MKKILVIDGNSIINRAFYGVRPLTTKSGKHTNAIFGMINIIMKQMNAIKPDYAAVAFDLKHPTFRHELYPEYKAGRHATPEELKSQFPDAKECLSLMGIHVLEMPGWEADDLQGTVAKMAYTVEDTESYVLSGDRDLLQLIGDKVTVLLATNQDTVTMKRAEFNEKYGVEPEQFVDMKALMGDSSDNIPGVAGVGEKTAANLIKEFGSLDGIYDNIDDKRITKGVREKLLRDKDNAYLSKKLAAIDTKAPVAFTLEDLRYTGVDEGGLYDKFTELELSSFIVKFGLKKSKAEAPSGSDAPAYDAKEYESISVEDLIKIKPSRFSYEKIGERSYVTFGEKCYATDAPLSSLAELFDGAEVICYDGKRLLHELADAGIPTDSIIPIDLMLYAYVISPGGSTSGVEPLASMFLGTSLGQDDPKAHVFEALEATLAKKIEADGLSDILYKIELPLLKILFEIERKGFKIDPVKMREFGEELAKLVQELQTSIYNLAGKTFNINSPKQLAEVLFVDLGLPYNKKKSKSGYSTDAETLEGLRQYSPIIDDLLEYRQVTKLLNTYALVLPTVADENDRIHTDFKQALTATGRLSSADPNLQNIPIRTKLGREMRRFFIADEGYTLVDADYSQIELRLLAHISDDYNMIESFKEGLDIHKKTAAAVFNMPEEYVTEDMRKRAKAVNFGIIYGISGFSLAKDIGTTTSEASGYIKNYLMNYPSVDRYLIDVVENAKENGYTATPMGRRRYIPELTAQNGMIRAFGKRVAMNAPIQGAAADIMKLAMIRVDERLKSEGIDGRIVMQVHDEIIVEVRDSETERCKAIIREEMENVQALSVPLTVDVTSGKSWLEQE